jgi:hypothetical protein
MLIYELQRMARVGTDHDQKGDLVVVGRVFSDTTRHDINFFRSKWSFWSWSYIWSCFGRVLVVFGRVFWPFTQDFMVFVKIFWQLIQSKIIIRVKL